MSDKSILEHYIDTGEFILPKCARRAYNALIFHHYERQAMQKQDRKKRFIRQLAEYLVGDQAKKSIELEMGKESAQQWSALRSTTPLSGYPTVDEAEEVLTDFLS